MIVNHAQDISWHASRHIVRLRVAKNIEAMPENIGCSMTKTDQQ